MKFLSNYVLIVAAFLLLPESMLMFTACSSDDEGKDSPVNIILDKTKVTITVDDEINIGITGIDANECTVSSDDEFIANAMIYNGKINVEAEHVGETTITVRARGMEAKCSVSVTSLIDYIGSTVTDWGITYEELKEKVERPYDSFMDDTQRKSKNYTYTISGYKVTNRYYFEDGTLCGVEKVIKGAGDDTDMFINITNSLIEHVAYETNYSKTINSYPKAKVQGCIYLYPQKYYAVYEQTRYDVLHEIGTRPETKNLVYFAKDLETAKEHKFTRLN